MEQPQLQVPTPIPKTPTISTTPTTTSTPTTKAPNVPSAPSFRERAADISASIVKARAAQDKINSIKSKYASIGTLQKSEKIQALKNTKLNPYQIVQTDSEGKPTQDSLYDAVSNSLHRWTTLAAKVKGGTYSEDQKSKIAGAYYDKEVAPFYAAMGSEVMPKATWLHNAYDAASRYDLDKMYQAGGVMHGTDSAFAQLDRAGEFATNFIGMAVHTGNDLIRGLSATGASFDPQLAPELHEKAMAWHNSVLHMQAVDAAKYGGKSYSDTAAAITRDISVLGAVQKFFQNDALESDFWRDVNPTHGKKELATSMVAETATTLPLFHVLGSATGILAGGAKAMPYIENLTNVLDKIPGGKLVAGALTAGGEGLAYGTLTRPNEDKNRAWQDALSFAALHTVFHIGGSTIGAGAKLGKESLGSLVEKYGSEEAKTKFDTHANNLELMVTKNQRPANPAEKYDAHKVEIANNLSVVGMLGQKAITEEAFKHILTTEKMDLDRAGKKELEAAMIKEDVAKNSPMLSMVSYIRGLLGERKLSDIEAGSKDYKFIQDRVSKLLLDASHSLDSAEAMHDATVQKASKAAGEKSAAKALSLIVTKLKQELAQSGVKGISEEQILERAKHEYAEANARGAVKAAKARNSRPLDEIKSAAKKRRDVAPIDSASYGERTRFTTNKKGEPAVSYSFNKEYKTYLTGKVPTWKSPEIKSWLEDLHAEDFNKDLEDFFYPKDLKDAGIFFEHESNREGTDNPNFLAFMYNYKDQMPKELGDEISRRIQDTPKFEKHFKGYKDVEEQVRFYALQMYNHVDDFVASGRWPKETNVFRSTQSDLLNPTIYQHELFNEREMQEQKNIKSMFRSPVAREQALAAYEVFASERRTYSQMKPSIKRATKLRELSDKIGDSIIEQGKGMFIPWRF